MWRPLRVAIGVLAVSFAGALVGCGSDRTGSEQPSDESEFALRDVPAEVPPLVRDACGSFGSTVRAANQFTEALTTASTGRINRVTSGKFAWVSIDAPPSAVKSFQEYEHFSARSPRDLQRFMKRSGPVPLELTAVALGSAPSNEHGYADVAYSGTVPGRPDLEMLGKGAINCDGTTRVWSMVIRDAIAPNPEASSVCGAGKRTRPVATTSGTVDACLQ
jgi:hypothetical protein